MFEQAPNGFFARDLMVFGSLDKGGIVAKGYTFEAPDFQNADDAELNRFHDQISLTLATLGPNQRLQVQWYCDSDYREELLRYREETARSANAWTRRCRNERFLRYWNAMKERKLRREKLTLFLSRRIDAAPGVKLTGAALQNYYDKLLDELSSEFTQFLELISSIFTGQGARVLPMGDAEHFRNFHRFLNPAVTARFDYDPLATFRPEKSIQENCWLSECVGLPDSGFFMDGHYHSILTLRQWPKGTFPGLIRRLTAQRILDYSITVNVTPLPVRAEILKEEKAHDRVAGDYAAEKRVSFLSVLAKKERKIKALMDGVTLPFNALFVVRVWDRTREGLAASTAVIKSAINSMNGAQYFEANVATTTKKLFYMTWPGWAWGRYTAHGLYAESHYLPDLLPFSSTFTGHLATAEAIYDGDEQNIIGLKTFSGEAGNMSPQHAVVLGMSGAGKSVNMCDLLTQTEPYYHYTVLIEEGLSYGIYTQTVDPAAQPIILQPDGTLTLNYLDTQGLPLSSLQLATCTALVCRMIGEAADADRQALRQAQVGKYLQQLYEDAFQDWSNAHPLQVEEVAREALAVSRYRKERMQPGATLLDAYAELRDQRVDPVRADEAESFVRSFDDGEVVRFLKEPSTQKEVMRLAFSRFSPDQYPTHSMLQESLQLGSYSETNRDAVSQMADMLLPWCRHGAYGALFDGTSNVSQHGVRANLNVVWNHKTYVLDVVDSTEPVLSAIFVYGGVNKHPAAPASVTPNRLLGMMDKAKSYPLLAVNYPQSIADVEVAKPGTPTDYPQFVVTVDEVYRFAQADTLVFKLTFKNKTAETVYYAPNLLGIRAGDLVFTNAISDASGTIPPNGSEPAYIAITGTPTGGRNDLSVKNPFYVVVSAGAPAPAASASLFPAKGDGKAVVLPSALPRR